MSNFENLDVNKYKITFSVDAESFEKGLKHSYEKNKKYFNISGFRKGKVPRKVVELNYGKEVLFEDAFNFCLQDAYPLAAKESGLEIVSRPEIDVISADTEKGVEFTAIVYTKPEVKLGDYKGLKYKKTEISITDEDVTKELEKIREKHSRIVKVTDRPIEDGDLANINFEGFMDGVAFEGGKGENYDLEIGSHSFIDTFEEQLIGKNIGDEVEVNVTFPAEYGQKELAGKPALFKVKVNEINCKELPEINDDLVADVTEFETIDEYKESIKEQLTKAKTDESDNNKKEELLESLVQNAEMNVPAAMFENEIDNKINEFKNNIGRQGLTLEQYLQYVGQSMENMREAYRIISEKQVKSRLALEAVALKESIEVSDEEIDAEITRISESYNIEKDKLKTILGDDEKANLIKDLQVQKALDIVIENSLEN